MATTTSEIQNASQTASNGSEVAQKEVNQQIIELSQTGVVNPANLPQPTAEPIIAIKQLEGELEAQQAEAKTLEEFDEEAAIEELFAEQPADELPESAEGVLLAQADTSSESAPAEAGEASAGGSSAGAGAMGAGQIGLLALGAVGIAAAADDSDSSATSAESTESETAGDTFTLTTSADDLTGTAGDDTFVASTAVGSFGGDDTVVRTLAGIDTLAGGAGTDTLNVELNENEPFPAADTLDPTISGIEVINVELQAIDDNANDVTNLDFSNVTGLEQLFIVDSENDDVGANTLELNADEVQNLVTAGIRDSEDVDLNLTYADDVLGSATATQSVVLDDAGTADIDADVTLATGGDDVITTLNVSSSGTTDANINNANVETVNITGSGVANIDFDSAAIETVDASEFTGTELIVGVTEATSVDLNVTATASDLAAVVINNAIAAAGNDNVVINLNPTGEGFGTLAVVENDGASNLDEAEINALDFTAGTYTGVDQVFLGADGDANGITLGDDAVLDLAGTTARNVGFGDNSTLDLDANILTISNSEGDLPATFTLDFDGEVTGTGEIVVEDATTLRIDTETLVAGDTVDFTTLTATDATTVEIDATNEGDVSVDTFNLASGTVGGTDTLTFDLLGDANINGAGAITLGADTTAINSVVINANGTGTQALSLDGVSDLAATAGGGQAAGTGVDINGTNDFELSASAAELDGLTVDATDNTGEVTLVVDGNGTFDAANITGIDVLELGAAGSYTINNLAEGIDLDVTGDLDNDTITVTGTATERSVTLTDTNVSDGNDVDYVDASVETLTITGAGDNSFVGNINTDALTTLNLIASGGNLDVDDVNTDAAGDTTLALNLTSDAAGGVTVDDISENATGDITAITINSTGNSGNPNTVQDIAAANGTEFTTLTVTGDVDLDVSNNSIALDGGADVTASDFTGDLALDVTVTATGSVITGGSGSDELTSAAASTEAITINGGAGDDQITGSVGNTTADVLNGGAGDDTLIAEAGDDTLDGGADTDTVRFDAAVAADSFTDTELVNIEEVTLNATGIDVDLSNQTEDLIINGEAGDNTIVAGEGADTITAGDGDDTLTGGAGANTFVIDDGGANTIEDLKTNDSFTVAAGAAVTATGVTAFVATAETNNDGSDNGDAEIQSADGEATTIDMSAANVEDAASQGFTITGGNNVDTLTGSDGNDTITGGAGNDTFNVDAGTDTINDLSDSDNLAVSAGATAEATVTADFTATTDTANDNGTATLDVGDGFDVDLEDATVGTAAEDGYTVDASGNAGASTLIGSDADDILTGGDGGDTITGGAGADTLTGGAGDDTFVFDGSVGSADVGNDITDFNDAGADDIDFTTNAATGTGITAGDFQAATVETADGDVAAAGGFAFVTDAENNTTAASLGDTDVAAFLADLDGAGTSSFEFNNADNVLYLAVTDGTDTGVFLADDQNGDTVIDADDLTQIVELTGVTTVDADDFADFTV